MNHTAPRQLVLDLPLDAATGAGDFLVSGSNAAAVDLIESWPHWPQPSALLVGPPASGKSHLAAVWRAKSHAALFAAGDLNDDTVALFQRDDVRALVVEDIDRGIADQRILFHLLNHARETKRHMLLTSAIAPGDLEIALPDLRSRLRALAMIGIAEPDDALLGAVLVKLFCDRQLNVEPAVISYLIRHMDRSMESARTIVGDIDTLALERQRKVTRATAAEALASRAGRGEGLD
ncbi:MAG: DnaA/Hda family protein [Hyphomicrobiaceae bacterium]